MLSALAIGTALVAMLAALFYTGVFGIDEPRRRALVHRVLRVLIGTAVALVAVIAGLLTSLAAPAAVAVVAGVAIAAVGQGIRGRLEHVADRWVLGSRLAGYANLNRFGWSLIQAPASDGLLSDLAGEVRRGLDLTWARVSLDAADGPLRVVKDGTHPPATRARGGAYRISRHHPGPHRVRPAFRRPVAGRGPQAAGVFRRPGRGGRAQPSP